MGRGSCSGRWGEAGPEQNGHQSRWGALTHTPPRNNLWESLSQALCAAFLPVLPRPRAGLMNGAQFRVGGRSAV